MSKNAKPPVCPRCRGPITINKMAMLIVPPKYEILLGIAQEEMIHVQCATADELERELENR